MTGSIDDQLADLATQLDGIGEHLADLALDRLHVAAQSDGPESAEAEALERRITRARRAVDKAAHLLQAQVREDID